MPNVDNLYLKRYGTWRKPVSMLVNNPELEYARQIWVKSAGVWTLVLEGGGGTGPAADEGDFQQYENGDWVAKSAEEAGIRTFHGFVFPYELDLSYDGATRTLTMTPIGASFDVWINGKKYTKTGVQTFIHSATAGDHFICYDETGALVESSTAWDFKNVSPVAFVYYSPTISDGYALFELHTYKRNVEWHESQHFAIGTFVKSGLVMSGYTINTATNAAITPLFSAGALVDEDIEYATSQINDGGPYTILRRSGTSDIVWTSTNVFPFIHSSNRINYNQKVGSSWQMSEAGAGKFVTHYVFATTALDANKRVYIVPGQTQHDSLSAANAENVANLDYGTFSLTEFAPLYKIVFQVSTGYGSTGQVRIAAVERITAVKGAVNISLLGAIHNALNGREDADAHPISSITGLQAAIDAADSYYRHVQSVAASSWPVAHNLGKYPAVSVVDSSGQVVEGDVAHVDVNNTTITFSGAFAGEAYFN